MISTKFEGIRGAAVIDCYLFDSGRRLACLFSNGIVRLYDTCSQRWHQLPESEVGVKSLAWTNSGDRYVLATVTESGHLRTFSLKNDLEAELIFEKHSCFPDDYAATSLTMNNDASLLVIAVELCSQSSKKSSNDNDDDDDDDDDDQAKLFFYDFRQSNKAQPLGCYKESHSNTVNTVKFASFCDEYLLSGGADGLVNVYDLKQATEDDALLYSFNCESSVARANFYGNSFQDANVYAVTDDNNLLGWNVTEGDEIYSLKNISLNKSTFLVDCFTKRDNSADVFPIFSDSDGLLTVGRLIYKSQASTSTVIPVDSCKAHESLIRCADWSGDLNLLATGADDGTVALCKLMDTDQPSSVQNHKTKLATKKRRSHPYTEF